jgi:hypothetical protein
LLPLGAADVQRGNPAQAATVLSQLADELEQRLANPQSDHAPFILCIHGLARFRDLRRDEDFGFTSFSDSGPSAPSTARQFLRILRDGPAVGIHSVVWCDSYNTFGRWFDRATLRDFSLRVLFQMSPADSSHFLDSPAANQLGACRALLYREDRGESEKFRPYRVLTAEGLRGLVSAAVT